MSCSARDQRSAPASKSPVWTAPTDFQINGVETEDRIGRAVASAVDFNGDGIDDIVLGSEFAGANQGAVYIVWLDHGLW